MHKRLSPLLTALLVLSCGGDTAVGPSRPPTPTPPAVTPTPPTSSMARLTPADLTSSLHAAVNCCADADDANGDEGVIHEWAFYDSYVDSLYTRAGVRLTEVRIGPAHPATEHLGPDASLERLEEVATAADRQGRWLLVGLWDAWIAVHGFNLWGDTCAVTQRAPQERHVEWVRRVTAIANRHPSITLFDGNEQFRCRPSGAWVRGLEDVAREAGYTGAFGSNAEIGAGDFAIHHGFRPVESGSVLLESDNRDHTPEEWQALRASSSGVVAYWRGPMSMAEWERLLLNPAVADCLPPPSCPPAGRMGVQWYAQSGGTTIFNITPRFGRGPNGGVPCDFEHRPNCASACGAYRLCEPPQGPEVRVSGAYESYRLQGQNHFKLNVVGIHGPVTVEACYRGDSTDEAGQALDLSNASCGVAVMP